MYIIAFKVELDDIVVKTFWRPFRKVIVCHIISNSVIHYLYYSTMRKIMSLSYPFRTKNDIFPLSQCQL